MIIEYDMMIVITLLLCSYLFTFAQRYQTGDTNLTSHCLACQHRLSFWDMIPIVSFLVLKGHCRYCQQPIIKISLMAEIMALVGAIFFTDYLIYFLILYTIFFCDYFHRLIPNRLTILLLVLNLQQPHPNYILAVLVFFTFSLLAAFKWLGWGDVKLLIALSLQLTFSSFNLLILISSGLALLFNIKQYHMHRLIPFGSYLSVAACVLLILRRH